MREEPPCSHGWKARYKKNCRCGCSGSFLYLVAVMTAAAVMVGAAGIGIILQFAGQQGIDCFVSITMDAAIELDTSLVQGGAGAAADAAADEQVDLVGSQITCQGAVTGTGNAEDLGIDDSAVFDLVELELSGMTEVGEDHFVLISNCNQHGNILLNA